MTLSVSVNVSCSGRNTAATVQCVTGTVPLATAHLMDPTDQDVRVEPDTEWTEAEEEDLVLSETGTSVVNSNPHWMVLFSPVLPSGSAVPAHKLRHTLLS